MELRCIPLSDVRPDENNPRGEDSMGDLDALAASFTLNATNPGEPINPIVVMRDANAYRIVDGERRYRAMIAAGTEVCHAVVCEDMADADAAMAMLVTNDKAELTDAEKSRGFQRMLALGVDYEAAEDAARLARGTAKKVARAVRAAGGDKAEQMSVEHLIAIADLEDEGFDEEALAEASAAKEGGWQSVVDKLRRKAEREQRKAAMLAVLDEAGITLVSETPEGSACKRVAYASTADGLKEKIAEAPPIEYAMLDTSGGRLDVDLYARKGDEAEPSPEEIERAKREDELRGALVRIEKRRREWYADAIRDDGRGGRKRKTPETDGFLVGMVFDKVSYTSPCELAADFCEASGCSESELPSGAPLIGRIAAYVYEWARPTLSEISLRRIVCGREDDYVAGALMRLLDFADALEADGYVPDDADATIAEVARGYLDACSAEEDEAASE